MISVILVNYKTAVLLLGAVSSIQTQEGVGSVEIIVVDNSVSDHEDKLLRAQLPSEVTYIRNKENTGFAKACNQAFARSSGDYVLLLNPDARLLPAALSHLVNSIETRPDAGAISPRAYWDDACQFLLPPSTFPSLTNLYGKAMARLHPIFAQHQALAFRKLALQLWTSKEVIQMEALSGGHVLLRRKALLECGGLFDERFFTYWEDTDLMQRLRIAGYRCYVDSAASCLHYYEHTPNKDHLIGQGWPIYKMKHLQGKLRFQFLNWLEKYLPPVYLPDFEPLEIERNMLRFPVPTALTKSWLLELSPSPQFIPAVGYFGNGSTAEVNFSLWSRLHENTYFARLSAPVPKPDLMFYWQWKGYSNSLLSR